MKDEKAKHTIIVDANLHIQDPHEIILSYFNTKNDTQFMFGSRKSFGTKIMMTFVMLVFLKMFFQEIFSGFFHFIISMLAALFLGFLFSRGLLFFGKILSNSARSDSLRGLFFQFAFITIIVITLGLFI